jgi:uncharacterized membrane protein YedE/YeeE
MVEEPVVNYWPWWGGALALGSITFASVLLLRRPLGVSGSWERVLHWGRERSREKLDAQWVVPGNRPLPVAFDMVFLLAMFVGGGAAAWRSGTFGIRTDLGADYANLVTSSPWAMALLLFCGGLLTGFGTRLAGGCSSGHGLSGCSRLHPGSLVATAVFFASAAGMSFLLWKVV